MALDHRDQKTGSLVWIQVAANCSLGLPSAQESGNSFLPGEEYPLQPLAELLVQRIDLQLAYQKDGIGTLLEEGRRPMLYLEE